MEYTFDKEIALDSLQKIKAMLDLITGYRARISLGNGREWPPIMAAEPTPTR